MIIAAVSTTALMRMTASEGTVSGTWYSASLTYIAPIEQPKIIRLESTY